MKVIRYGPITSVVLSRRNLLALLAKLDGHPPNSLCSIDGGADAPGFMVTAEEDHFHYRDRPAGEMIEETEDLIPHPPTGILPYMRRM